MLENLPAADVTTGKLWAHATIAWDLLALEDNNFFGLTYPAAKSTFQLHYVAQ